MLFKSCLLMFSSCAIVIVLNSCAKKEKQTAVPTQEQSAQASVPQPVQQSQAQSTETSAPSVPAPHYDYLDAADIIMAGNDAIGKTAEIDFYMATKSAGEIGGYPCKNGRLDPTPGDVELTITPVQRDDVKDWPGGECRKVALKVTRINRISGFSGKLLKVID